MKTNIFRYAFSLLAVLAAVASCGEKQPEEQGGTETVDPVFPSQVINETVEAGASVELRFDANLAWKVEISGDGKGNMFWLDDAGMKKTSISSDKTGPQVVSVVFSADEEFDKNRVCEVTLTMGGESKKIATYTRLSLNRTFEVFAGVVDEFGFKKVSGAYEYGTEVVTAAELTTFEGNTTYVLPLKVVTNYAWNLVLPSWVSSETMEGAAGVSEVYLTAVLSDDVAEGAKENIRFVDAANPAQAFELELSLPAFAERAEVNFGTTLNFDAQGLVEGLTGSFLEIPAFFELLAPSTTVVKVVDWNEQGQYYGTTFSEWVELTLERYDDFTDEDVLIKTSVEFRAPANETYDDRYADVFVLPASAAEVALDDWFDPATGNIKSEFAAYIVGRISQTGLERDYITLSETDEVYEVELAKYVDTPWWGSFLNTENLFELVYKDEYSDAVLVFDEPYASFKYFDYDFNEVAEADMENFWLSFNGFSSNQKGRVAMDPALFDRTDVEFPESFVVFYDADGNELGAIACRYTKKSSVVTGDVLALESGVAELIKLGEESEMKMFLASEFGNMGVLDVYQLTTSDKNVVFTSQVEAWGHKILTAVPPMTEWTDAPFTFENQANVFGIFMGETVTEPVESVILLQAPGADGVTLLNFVAIHYIYDPSAGGENPDGPQEPETPEEPEFDETGTKMFSIGAGSGTLVKFGKGSERYKAMNEKYGLSEVYLLTTGDRHVFLSGDVSLQNMIQLDPATLAETSGTDAITFEGSDSGFNIYLRGTEPAEALIVIEEGEGYAAAVYVSYDYSIGIPSPFEFTNPSAVEGKATLSRCEGDRLTAALEEFGSNVNFDERNIYELKYTTTSVKAEITIPSAPADNAAWNNYPVSSSYWLTCKVSGKKMTVTMKESGKTDYFVFRTSDGNWAWILVCTCE